MSSSFFPRIILAASVCAVLPMARAQQAASSIEQARLFQKTPTATNVAVNANGTAVSDTDVSDDDSFGAQVILKNKEPVRTFVISGDTSVFYTSNVALTRRDETSDAFFVTDAAASWSPRLSPQIEAQVALHASIFRYDGTSALDFEDFGAGAGLAWNPQNFYGVGLFARYDFTQLLNRHSDKILSDHQFSVGTQKSFQLSRALAFTAGLLASAGISDPHSAQRDQLAAFVGYHCALSRSLEVDFTYRAALYRYNSGGRADVNQVVAAYLRYHFNELFEADAFLTFADNRSNRSAFDYAAFTSGGGLAVRWRF